MTDVYKRFLLPFLGFLLLLLTSTQPADANSGISGMPLFQRFGPEDYAAAPVHLSVLSDTDGSLYVGNIEGVLHYDGSTWSRIELPGHSVARSLVRGKDGRIYVGSYDQFGYIDAQPNGEFSFHDLRPTFGLKGEERHLGDIWTIIVTDDALYFQASARLLRLGDDGSTRSWPLAPEVRGLFGVGSTLYARVNGSGFSRFDDGRFTLVAGGDLFESNALNALIPREDGLLLIGPDAFYRYDGDRVVRLTGEAEAIFNEAEPYLATPLEDGSIVIGTLAGELLRFDADLNFQSRVPLGPYSVLALATDTEGGLWAATEGDLVRLRMPSPWSVFSAADGIPGSISDSAWSNGSLWVANSRGIARAERGKGGRVTFRQIIETTLEAYDLIADENGLLIGEREGLLWLPAGNEQPERLLNGSSAFFMLRSRFDTDTVFVAMQNAVVRLTRKQTSWKVEATWPLGDLSLTSMLETSKGVLWIGNSRGGAQRWTLSDDQSEVTEKMVFGPENGLDFDPDYGSGVLRLDDQLLVNSGKHAFRFDGERFLPFNEAPFTLVERPMEMDIVSTPLGVYAYTTRELWRRDIDATQWKPVHLGSRLARGFSNVHMDEDGSLRIITWNSLLQFDPIDTEVKSRDLSVSLRRIEFRGSGEEQQLLPLTDTGEAEYPAGSALRLKFALITMEPGAEVRWRIIGRVDNWSDWASVNDSTLNFGRLEAGDYRLEVEGRVPSGRAVSPLKYNFHVPPLWYRTHWAMAIGLLLLLGLIALIVQLVSRIRYRNFVAINQRLEQKITERTRELEDANERLAELATEDSLTGVANRRALEQALNREWQRCSELNSPLSIIMVDVDHFKRYNDRHGHLEGDKRLRWVADQLSSLTKPVRELVARFGGEEFVVVLPGFGADRAMQRAEQLRRRFTEDDSDVTISLGVATEIPRLDQDPAQLLQRADTALYRAKRRGRNRAELAED